MFKVLSKIHLIKLNETLLKTNTVKLNLKDLLQQIKHPNANKHTYRKMAIFYCIGNLHMLL